MNETVLITGASSGIGLEFARLAAADGCNLILVARSQDKLEALAAELRARVEVTVLAADLAQPGACLELAARLAERNLHVDVLVNNAGFATYGPFLETERQALLEMLAVNMTSLTDLTRLLAPAMVERGRGRILNVASTAAFQPGPLMAAYYATKAYVLSLSEGLSDELEGTGVSVTVLCPGPTESGFQARANMQESRLMQGRMPTSAAVAAAGWKACRAGKVVYIPGWRSWLIATAVRFLPRALVRKLVRKAQERR